jgi:ubiquinone/menaquinone biosynthesis C-methylase UbiE
MAIKSQTGFFPELLRNRQYSGTLSTLVYNWPIFGGALFFGGVALTAGFWLESPWNWILWIAGIGSIGLILNILIASFIVYDWGSKREYDRLIELADLQQANVIIDITCGKLRGTQGLLSRLKQGHYFLIDVYDAKKMTDPALRWAREMAPPLEAERRIYRRTASPEALPIPHNWADVVYCSFSLHELQNNEDRQKIFAEFARILKPNGKLLLAEHGRDLPNFIAFGLGVLSFFSPGTWAKHIKEAGLTIQHHERWRGLVHLWVAERKAR